MEKKFLLSVFIIVIAFSARAQVDLSVNPLTLLFKSVDIHAEYRVYDNIGVELTPSFTYRNYGNIDSKDYTSNGFGIKLIGKYYFIPEAGCDKWNIGPYFKYGSIRLSQKDGPNIIKSTRFAIGVYLGYKWVTTNNVIIELGFGMGRAFVNKLSSADQSYDISSLLSFFNIDLTTKFGVGYRF